MSDLIGVGEKLKDSKAKINDLSNRVDNLVQNTGNSNSEIVDARLKADGTTYQTLRDRLNAADVEKADKDYVDSVTQAMASGAPKGVYATLAALQTAFPTGDNHIYLVTADGKWYYWNGAAWTAGAVYQATGLAAGSVTPAIVNSQIPTVMRIDNTNNLYEQNKGTLVIGKYISNAGVETTLSTMDYFVMPVTPGALYCDNLDISAISGNPGAYFDGSGNFICALNATGYGNGISYAVSADKKQRGFIPPTNAATAKINLDNSKLANNMVVYQDITKVHIDQLTVPKSWLPARAAYKDDPMFIANLVAQWGNLGLNQFGYYYSDGRLIQSTTIFGTAPFPVVPGEVYEISNFVDGATDPTTWNSSGHWRDANGKFISNIGSATARTMQYTAPANAAYAVFNFMASMSSTFSIRRLSAPSYPTQIPKGAIYPAIDAPANTLNGEHWTSFGDSVTYQNAWQPYVITALSLVHTNCGIGSTALAGPALGGGDSFWMDSRLNAVEASNPDILTIMGGINDQYYNIAIGTNDEFTKDIASKNVNVFKGAYSYIIEKLLTWKPTLRILLMTTPYFTEGPDFPREYVNATTGLSAKDFAQATREVAQYYGLPCIDIFGEAGINWTNKATYLSDSVHPNDAGGRRFAEVVIGRMRDIMPVL